MRPTTFTCFMCGKQTEKYSYQFAAHPTHRRYCSNTCKWAAWKAFGKPHPKTPNVEIVIPTNTRGSRISAMLKGRTVTPEWRAKISATILAQNVRGEAHPNYQGPVAKTCEYCRETYLLARRGTNIKTRRFCSHECADASRKATSHLSKNQQELGRIHRQYHDKTWEPIAAAIRERDNYTCQTCGKHQLRPKLDVHHIRKAREFLAPADGHIPSNLITLCRSCHIKVDQGSLVCPPIPA